LVAADPLERRPRRKDRLVDRERICSNARVVDFGIVEGDMRILDALVRTNGSPRARF
jgi:hypothetical protein